jgi:hypothetical protein
MMMDDAIAYKKELYIICLDFKDAFGSIPHDLLRYNLKKTGILDDMSEVIIDFYIDTFTNIITGNGVGDDIHIRKGVKQGCLLNPTLFNLCVDPLIRRLDHYKDQFGYKFGQCMKEQSKAVQAYAGDVLLFSDSREGVQAELDLVKEFVQFTKIELNPKKCRAFKYTKGKEEFVTPIGISNSKSGKDWSLPWVEGY